MKKIIIISAVALMAVFGCSNSKASQAELIAAYRAEIESLMNEIQEEMNAIHTDETLSEDEIAAKAGVLENEFETRVIDLALETIRKHGKDSVAITALQDIYYMVEVDQLEAAISGMSDEIKSDEFVKKVSNSLQSKKSTKEGEKFTDFTIEQYPDNEDKGIVKFSDYVGKGKYVLVDFWASWCGPCKREIPNIKHVYETYAGDKFDVLSVAVWDKPEDTEKAAYEHGVVWNQIINAQSIPTDIYGIDGIPHIMLVGPDGTIVKRDLRGAAIEAAVKAALGL